MNMLYTCPQCAAPTMRKNRASARLTCPCGCSLPFDPTPAQSWYGGARSGGK